MSADYDPQFDPRDAASQRERDRQDADMTYEEQMIDAGRGHLL